MTSPAPGASQGVDPEATIASIRAGGRKRAGRQHHRVARLARSLGHPVTLYGLAVLVIVWVLLNATRFRWDAPPYFELQGILALYAAVVSTIVLTAQNHQLAMDERRSYLELQINLVAEQKAAKIIELLEELRRDLPEVANRRDLEAERLAQAVDPHVVLDAVDRTLDSPLSVPGSKLEP